MKRLILLVISFICILTVNVHAEEIIDISNSSFSAKSFSVTELNEILNKSIAEEGLYKIEIYVNDKEELTKIINVGEATEFSNSSGRDRVSVYYYAKASDETIGNIGLIQTKEKVIKGYLDNRKNVGSVDGKNKNLTSANVFTNLPEISNNKDLEKYIENSVIDKDNSDIVKYNNHYYIKKILFYSSEPCDIYNSEKYCHYMYKAIKVVKGDNSDDKNINLDGYLKVDENIKVTNENDTALKNLLVNNKVAVQRNRKGDLYTTGYNGTLNSRSIVTNTETDESIVAQKFTKARALAASLTAVSSYADGDYIFKSIDALNGLSKTEMYKEIKNNEVKDILNDMMILLKFRQPLYKTSSNGLTAVDTSDLTPVFVKDLLYEDKLTLAINNNIGVGDNKRKITTKKSDKALKNENEIFTVEDEEENEEQRTLSQVLGILDQNSNDQQVENVDYTLSKYTSKESDKNVESITYAQLTTNHDNIVLVSDSEAYLTNPQNYINYLYLHKLKDELAFTSRVDLMSPVFMDGAGNIITENNIMILPAISNNRIMTRGPSENQRKKLENFIYYNTKCFTDVMSSRIEISSNVYENLLKFYRVEIDTTGLDNTIDYIVTQHFSLKKIGNKYYIELNSFTSSDGQKIHVVNKQWYNTNKSADCVNFIYYTLKSKQTKLQIPMDVNGDGVVAADGSETLEVKGSKYFTTSDDADETCNTMYKQYLFGSSAIVYYVLCGYKQNALTEITSELLKSYDLNTFTVCVLEITDAYTSGISKLFPSFLVNSQNIFEQHIGNLQVLDIYQIVLIGLLWVGFIIIIIKMILSFSLSKMVRTLYTYVLCLLLIAGVTTATGWIQYAVQNIMINDAQNSLALRSIVESENDFRKSVTKRISYLQDTAKIKVEDRKIEMKDMVDSVTKLNNLKTWSDLYNEELEENPIRKAGNILDYDTYAYYMNLNRFSNTIGIRDAVDSQQKHHLVFTYDENVSLPDAYMPVMVIMQTFVDRMQQYVEQTNFKPSSQSDNRRIDISSKINNSYGLAYLYYYMCSDLNRKVKAEYTKYNGGYDITGLSALLKPYFTKGDPRFGGNEFSRTYLAYNTPVSTSEVIEKPSYSDEGNIKQEGTFNFKPITLDALDTFKVDETQWIKAVYDERQQDKVINAIGAANEEFFNALTDVFLVSSTIRDKDLILYCAVRASMAFNREIGNACVSFNVNDFSNDLILSYAQNGRYRFIASSGRTLTRYMFENGATGLIAFMNFLGIVLFDVLSFFKYVLLVISVLAFIYSVILQGVVKTNATGVLSSIGMYTLVHVATSIYITLTSMIANLVNNVTMLCVVNSVVIALLIFLIIFVIRNICNNATNGGFDALMHTVGAIQDGVANAVEGFADTMLGATDGMYNLIRDEKFMQETTIQNGMRQASEVFVENVKKSEQGKQIAETIAAKTEIFNELGV